MGRMVLLLLFLTGQVRGNPSAICSETTTTDREFKFEFRLQDSAGVSGIQFYDASENPNFVTAETGTGCSTTTTSGGLYSLSFDVDVDSTLPCGIVQDTGDTSVYKIAISPIGEETVYTFQCDTDNLQIPIYVKTNYITQHLIKSQTYIGNPAMPVKFQLVYSDQAQSPVPAGATVPIGQPLHLRVIYDQGMLSTGKNLYGMTFHVGVFPDPGATVTIQISTPGLGTNVKVTGNLSGKEIDEDVVVKREHAAEITVVDDYMPTGEEKKWKTETKGLKIESQDCYVGVKVTVEQGNKRMSYIAYPDRILGKNHRFVNFDDEQHFIIVATKDNTEIDLDVDVFNLNGLKVDGNNIGNGQKNIKVDMNEYDTFHLICDSDCHDIQLTSDENIAVIVGMEKGNSYFKSQIPPIEYLDTDFLVDEDDDLYMTTDAIGSDATILYKNTNNIGESDDIKENDPFRLQSDTPIYTFQEDSKMNYFSASFLPGRAQMTRRSYFYFTVGYSYDVKVMYQSGDSSNINYETSAGVTVPVINDDSFDALNGNPPDLSYELGTFTVTPSSSDTYMFFSTTDLPFHTQVTEYKTGTTSGARLISFGTLFPTINPCVKSTGYPSDGEDNDCDGFTDEEKRDLSDDATDIDIDIDDDLYLTDALLENKIRVRTLQISDNAGFTGSQTYTIHVDGCNPYTSTQIDTLASVKAFTHNTGLSDSLDDLWVLDTPMFRAFRYTSTDDVYFRAYVESCFNDCESSCQSRKRRSETDLHHVDLKVKVSKKSAKKKDCSHNKYYWLPHFILMLIILLEVATTCYFLYVKYKLKRD